MAVPVQIEKRLTPGMAVRFDRCVLLKVTMQRERAHMQTGKPHIDLSIK